MLRLTRTDFVLWSAWVVAAMLSATLSVMATLRPFGIPFGYQPGSLGYEVSFVLVSAIGLALLQYVVLRAAAGLAALPATAWMALTVVVGIGEYAATGIWVSSPVLSGLVAIDVIDVAIPVAFSLFGGLLMGLVLWKALHGRSALFVWPAASVAAYAAPYAAFVWGPFIGLLGGLPLLAGLLIGNALIGGLYGAITGVALVGLTRHSRRAAALQPS
ncbi:MAG: hypothetical protein AUI15_37875 [Actinobacteria bacterium 13_2_20CM_2_66_6]|nr:MAG: hypothetical protein AUI15_37875 [Actinobacteria bacterium 13_2_20CM_2_66_6]